MVVVVAVRVGIVVIIVAAVTRPPPIVVRGGASAAVGGVTIVLPAAAAASVGGVRPLWAEHKHYMEAQGGKHQEHEAQTHGVAGLWKRGAGARGVCLCGGVGRVQEEEGMREFLRGPIQVFIVSIYF